MAIPALAIKGGSGIAISNGSVSTKSGTTDFLENGTSLSCSSSTGKLIVDTSNGTLAWCNGSTTYQSAFGNDAGAALAGDSATSFFSSGTLESSIGGTGNGFTKFSGPASAEKTFTLPNASAAICTDNSICTGYQAALSGGDVTTSSGGASASIGNDKVTEAMLKAIDSPSSGECLSYTTASGGDFEWKTCVSSGGITGLTGDNATTTTASTVSISGTSPISTSATTSAVSISLGTVPATIGGTGVTSYTANTMYYAPAATPSALLPVPTPTSSPMFLRYNGSSVAPSWSKVDLTTDVTGTLPTTNGGTGITSLGTGVATALGINTGTAGSFLVNGGSLGTPSGGDLSSATNLPISTGVSGLGTGVSTFLSTPSSSNLISAVTDETGSGSLVFSTSPTLTTPNLGVPSTLTLTNATGLPIGTAGVVTGALPATNGGTGVTSYTANTMYYAPSATPGALLPVPTPTASPMFLRYNGSSVAPSWSKVDLTTDVSGILPSSNGGTGNGFTKFSGPTTSEKTFTLPNNSATICTTDSVCSGYGDVTSVGSACTTGACDSISIADTYKIDLSAVNASSTTEGLFLPQNTSCTSATAEGQVCWDSDNNTLYMGNGTTSAAVGGGSGVNSVITTVSESTVSSGTTPVYMSASGAVSTTDSYQTQTIVPAGTWANLRCVLSQVRAGATNPTVTFSYGTCGSALTSSEIVATFNNGSPNIATDTTNTRTTSANDCINFKLTKATGLNASAWLSCTIERTAN